LFTVLDYKITELRDYSITKYPMSKFAEPMARLIDELKKLPGIGSKTAQRLGFHILRSNDEDAEALAAAVRDVKAKLRLCSICNNITDVDPCVYCSSATRNQRISERSRRPNTSMGFITCCMDRFLRCTESAPNSCEFPT
jgi:RecR, helix-hairpin-helix/RecR, Cys4-zinc finger motif